MKVMLRNAAFSTLGEMESVLFVGPTAPAQNRRTPVAWVYVTIVFHKKNVYFFMNTKRPSSGKAYRADVKNV